MNQMLIWLVVSIISLISGVFLVLRGIKKLLGQITFKNPRLVAPSPEAMSKGNIIPVPKVDVGFEISDDAALVEVKDDILSLLRIKNCKIRVITTGISIITLIISTIILLNQIKNIYKRYKFKYKHPRLANNPKFPVFTFDIIITVIVCLVNFILSSINTNYYTNDIQKQEECSDGSKAVSDNYEVIKLNMIIIAVGIGIFLLLGICKIPVLGEIIGEFTGFYFF